MGQGRRVENLEAARHAYEIEARRQVVLPGFVDSHAYLLWSSSSLPEFEGRMAAGGVSLVEEVRSAFRDVSLTPSRTLERRGRLACEHYIRQGVTTLEAKTGWGMDRRGEMKSLRVLSSMASLPLEIVPTYAGASLGIPLHEASEKERLAWIEEEMLPLIARRGFARFVDVRCGRDGFPVDDARRCLTTARALGLGLKVQAEQSGRAGGVRLAVELGAVSADGLDHVNAEDVAALAQSGTVATLLPAVAFHRGRERFAPARALIDNGAAVALATGFGPGLNPACSIPMVLALACRKLRMSPAEAISAITINGAHALGCADRAGSLEAGKAADLVLCDAPDYREIAYCSGGSLVTLTMKRGQVLYQRGEVRWPAV